MVVLERVAEHLLRSNFVDLVVDDDFCKPCLNLSQKGWRPTPKQCDKFLPFNLKDNPETKCTKGDHAAYGDALRLGDKNDEYPTQASYFMFYHTILKTSPEYTAALKSVRKIGKNISKTLGVEVFPYRRWVYHE
ncbi:Niemann-Pick C1 protein [Stylophora pistillata]|uniref:Niemann-Pick C1 protein n=1 Tax=Stylophora pistillata TaxID=50429 RepID=A0A2B4RI52_STYPI|nr:Niemann-Pick C1 protein [Stylophora pistillata]